MVEMMLTYPYKCVCTYARFRHFAELTEVENQVNMFTWCFLYQTWIKC